MVILQFILLLALAAFTLLILFQYRKGRKKLQLYNDAIDKLKNEKLILQMDNELLNKRFAESEVLATVVRQSPNAIMLMDKEGNIQWINLGFTEMYGYTFDQFTAALGHNYRQTSFSPDVQHRLDTIAATKEPYRYEALNISRHGRELWTQTALVPVLDVDGHISHMVTIDTDIHNRVVQSDHLIAEMEQLNEKIDHLGQQYGVLNSNFASLFNGINELYQLIDQTDQILKFIKSISDETKILGINASIEAARAGAHGQGFRVITNAIIDISAKTIQSIKEINQILGSISEKQDELIVKKADSENRMKHYQELVVTLKSDVRNIESSIEKFKSLA